jgi:hypothetical protein
MMRDEIALGALLFAFATLVTVHVTLAIALSRRAPRWRGPVALVVAPLAPWWAWREGMRVRCGLWGAAALAYAVALISAMR